MLYSILAFVLITININTTDQVAIQQEIRQKIETSSKSEILIGSEKLLCQESIKKFYLNHLYVPIWSSKPKREDLIKELKAADLEGLNPQDYHYNDLLALNELYSKLNVQQLANFDLLATDAFLLYTSHLLSGKVNPVSIDAEWHVSRREGDPLALLNEVYLNNKLSQSTSPVKLFIDQAKPRHSTYAGLKLALKQHRAFRMKYKIEEWEAMTNGETLKLGMKSERLVKIRERLVLSGDLSSNDGSDSYDKELLEAVKLFQERNGLTPDGEIGKGTIQSMNVSLTDRINQIKVNMERWRWLPQEFGAYYIKVNIADFTLELYRDGEMVRKHKAIVGKDYRRTPVFSSKMQYLVISPNWTVPPGILNADVIPGARKDPQYLTKKKLIVYGKDGSILDPANVDWNSSEVRSYTYRQAPGPDNALGAVKFMFPNSFSVYIHDTPSRDLFDKTERSLSSGCIRIQNPLDLAEYVINDPQTWPRSRINSIVESKTITTINLKEKPDVYILYWTSWVDSQGSVQFRKDIYNRDAAVLMALNK